MALDLIPKSGLSIKDRLVSFIEMALNSSVHLQNVIEDALDVSRIENNKFQLFMENFEIRQAVHEVCSIMRF